MSGKGVCMRCLDEDMLLFPIRANGTRSAYLGYVCSRCFDEIQVIRRMDVKYRLKAGIIKKMKKGTCELCNQKSETMFPILTRSEATEITNTVYICPSCCEKKKLIDNILNEFKIEDKIKITMWDE